MFLIHIARGRMPSSVRHSVDFFWLLEENAGDVVQSMAGRVLGRLLRTDGQGMEPRVDLASLSWSL